jgi:hypothetical protein
MSKKNPWFSWFSELEKFPLAMALKVHTHRKVPTTSIDPRSGIVTTKTQESRKMKRLLLVIMILFAAVTLSYGQATSQNGGSIQGSITDPSGATVPDASVSILSVDTGAVKNVTTDKAGYYSVGPLNPGSYTVSVSGSGFQKLSVTTIVRIGTATPGNFKLTLGSSAETVEVNAGELQVNT